MSSINGKLSAWLHLVRLPNLLTVPGDPLAGYFLAMAAVPVCGSILFPVAASLFLYTFGLMLNDLVDLKDDARERPGRPLPCGQVKPVQVILAMVILLVMALGFASMNGKASLALAGILAAAIIIYNVGGKRIPLIGPLNMGICRGLSLLLGASAAGLSGVKGYTVLSASVLLTVYITSVTIIASKETSQASVGPKRWLPAILVMIFAGLLSWNGFCGSNPLPLKILSSLLAIGLVAWCWNAGSMLAGQPLAGVVPVVIGKFIQGLLILQAFLLSLCGWPAAVVTGTLLLVFPVFSVLARRFYSS